MKIFKLVRKAAGLSMIKMQRAMGKNSIQAYSFSERASQKMSTKDILKLREIFPGTDAEFMDLIRRSAK